MTLKDMLQTKKKKYEMGVPIEIRLNACRKVANGRTVPDVAQEYEVSRSTMNRWLRDVRNGLYDDYIND